MDLYTLDRSYAKQDPIEDFESLIWTERYYGDDDFKLVIPKSMDNMEKLPKGQLLLCEDSKIPMILEHREIKDNIINATGISLVKWMNNRTIRDADSTYKETTKNTNSPGYWISLWLRNYAGPNAAFPSASFASSLGISTDDADRMVIPNLVLDSYDNGNAGAEFTVRYGPLYDALRELAVLYELGMKIELAYPDLRIYVYKGTDRSSSQNVVPVIQFSPEMDTLANITDLESISEYSNVIYAFAENMTHELAADNAAIYTALGKSSNAGITTGLDFRPRFVGVPDVPITGLTEGQLEADLSTRATPFLDKYAAVSLVDGEILPNEEVKYGTNFFLGDIVEVKGNTDILNSARITEYIRSQDGTGERAYPTLAMI